MSNILLIALPTKFFIPIDKRTDVVNKIGVRYMPRKFHSTPILKKNCNDVYSYINTELHNVDYFDCDARLIKKYKNSELIKEVPLDIDLKFDSYDYILLSLRREPGTEENIATNQIEYAKKIISYLKKKFPKSKCFIGSTQFSDHKEEMEKYDLIDYQHIGSTNPNIMNEILNHIFPFLLCDQKIVYFR